MPKGTQSGKKEHPKASFALEKNAGEGIEEAVFWRTAGIIAKSQTRRSLEVGTATAIRWKGRSFLLTAGHVVDPYSDAELQFVFRPEGTLYRDPWHESAPLPRPDQLALSLSLRIIARFRSRNDDLAALEVDPTELNRKVRFFELDDSSKVVHPIRASLCAIGIPADAFQRLRQIAGAVTPFSLWGNIVRAGKNPPSGYDRRRNLLMQFLPAKDGRKPHGFSGSGAWYQVSRKAPPLVWRPDPTLAGIITHYFPGREILLICRVERVVAFLRTVF
jgi:hypothetical protein